MKPQQKRSKRWYWIIGLAAVVLLAAAIMKGRNSKTGTEVAIEKSAKRSIIQTVSATGKVFPETEVSITSDVSGTIVEMFVQEGDSVREGQLLCRINAELITPTVDRAEAAVKSGQSQVENLRAQLRQAEANLANTRETFRRNEQLLKDGVISKSDFDNIQTQVRSSEAAADAIRQSIAASEFNVQSATATVKEQRENLRRTSIYAPTSGVVSKLNKKKGEQVVGTIQMAGTEIMRIANLNALEVRVDVSENDIVRVSKGDTALIEVDAYVDRKFKGIVTHIANSASNLDNTITGSVTSDKVTNFVVKIHLLQSSYSDLTAQSKGKSPFLPGMSASADIRTETLTNILTVPIQAVTTREEGDTLRNSTKSIKERDVREVVFIASADTVAKRVIKTGIQDDRYIQITTGLNEGEDVIIAPYTVVSRRLKGGEKIKVVPEKDLYKTK